MAEYQILIAGFGGQGLLFSGKVLAYAGLLEGKQLSWLPSYGPEMRGGTANCSVILSEEPVGSPIVNNPNVLMVMNAPSLDKMEDMVQPGGTIFVDSSLISRPVRRSDVKVCYIPATQMAKDMGVSGLANMIMLGLLVRETGCITPEALDKGLQKVIPARKAAMLDSNRTAIQAGWDYQC